MIYRDVHVEVKPTPAELAGEFWRMDANQMAVFFNCISEESEAFKFAMQMQYLTDSNVLHSGGRSIMETIGKYADRASK